MPLSRRARVSGWRALAGGGLAGSTPRPESEPQAELTRALLTFPPSREDYLLENAAASTGSTRLPRSSKSA